MISREQIQNSLTGVCDGPTCRIFPNNVGCEGIRNPDGKIPPCYRKPVKIQLLIEQTLENLGNDLHMTPSAEEKITVKKFVSELEIRKVPLEALEKIRERHRQEKQMQKEIEDADTASLTPAGLRLRTELLKKYYGDRTKFTFAEIRALGNLRKEE